ncbi:hypothetical protein M430DRAFT_147114 [Amorphotheca resinae ATCC 22711]|uniref:Pre-mRNA-splicing factor CWC24 n=1 Tax=Amorphotheca resinae ATCC 22711 TaxID=857342 RepID=A0A2T3ASJ0_AMORE|nr:hypothetical protein M430DRAFT_147114 [Amorphotheca resinae ATCC 22711]PSS09327.1 hypothetical protein M430DRAFT_147114 [Amorphotheca resinae ATCC 22711]
MDTTDTTESPQPATATEPVAVFKKRSAKGKSNFRKRAATPPPASDSDSDFSSSADESGQRIKRRKKNTSGVITASTKSTAASSSSADLFATKYEAAHNTTIKSVNDATKHSNWYDEHADDALSHKNLLGTTRSAPAPDGTYKGLANTTNFIQKNPDAPTRVVGPVKAPTNIRTITVTDFAPDVCKDYKQTGFCGFGDNCKFLHAREDYKQGWQLDREWENVTKGKKVTGGTTVASANRKTGGGEGEEDDSGDEEAMLEGIPFACIICREKYKDPIVTKCGHYFCLDCALKRYRKDPSCAACGAGTGGVFNVAKNLKKLLDRKRERAAKRRQKAIEAGEEVSDEEEEEG